MFIHCPHCQSLVATDPATSEPPERCPRCSKPLAEPTAHAIAPGRGDPGKQQTGGRPSARVEQAIEPEAEPAPAGPVDAVGEDPAPSAGDAQPHPESDATADAEDGQPQPPEAADLPAAAPDGAAEEAAGPPEAEATRPTVAAVEADDRPEDHDRAGADAGTATAATSPPSPTEHTGAPAPRFAHVRATAAVARGRARWRAPLLVVGLTLLLALQWTLADRERLAADARWRPLVTRLCGVLRCEVPPWREPAAFVLLDRDVRPHAGMPGVLRVTATFRNTARWDQPWPQVLLTLSDVEGSTVGMRAFTAEQYLGDPPTQETVASGQTATIRLEVIEPPRRSVAFAFDFR